VAAAPEDAAPPEATGGDAAAADGTVAPSPFPFPDDHGHPTLRSVAALAGVHVSTASRALSGPSATGRPPASASTIERIRQVADELGYERNPHATGLRTRRSNLVGVLVPRLSDFVLATIYEGIDAEARRRGVHTFVTNTLDEPDTRRSGVQALLARRVDGLILGDARVDGDDVLADLQRQRVPYVLTSRTSGEHPSVTCDDVLGGRLAAEHLLERGHERVGVVAGEPYASTGRDRTAGFAGAFAAAGIPVPENRVVASAFDVAGGRRAAEQLLAAGTVTAIFAVNDFAAIGALAAVQAAGLEAGRDIAVVGYNDTALAAQLPVPLTSVRSPMVAMGEAAMAMLFDRMEGRAVTSSRLPPELQARASTAFRV
jgi:LacI family transcriptional regulator